MWEEANMSIRREAPIAASSSPLLSLEQVLRVRGQGVGKRFIQQMRVGKKVYNDFYNVSTTKEVWEADVKYILRHVVDKSSVPELQLYVSTDGGKTATYPMTWKRNNTYINGKKSLGGRLSMAGKDFVDVDNSGSDGIGELFRFLYVKFMWDVIDTQAIKDTQLHFLTRSSK